MNKHKLMENLREVRFLHDADEEHLRKIAEIAKLVTYQDNEIIFREGDPTDYVYFVVCGGVSLQMCAPGVGCKKILTVGPGEILGWSALLEQTRLTATAQTINLTRVVQVHAGLLLTLCDHDPRFGHEIMRRTSLALAKRLNATRIQLLDLYGGHAPTPPLKGATVGEEDAC